MAGGKSDNANWECYMRGLIFDFDGLILDTEMPEFQSWQEIFQWHACSLPLSVWAECIGTSSDVFDPYGYLEQQLGCPIDRETVRAGHRQRCAELLAGQPVLPGVLEYFAEARRLGMRLGVASSSSHRWVDAHLARLELLEMIDCVRCVEDVGRAKPEPDLYLAVLDALGLRPDQAIALEDSPNGVLAARQAGIFCVAVPNPLTRELPLDHANLIVPSLADLPLADLLARVWGNGEALG